MEDSDLYKLPKDVLVKLLATFRQDVQKALEDKYSKQISKLELKKEILNEIMEDLDDRGIFYNIEQCCHPNCSNYMIENDGGVFFRTADIYSCDICGENSYCNSHYSQYFSKNMECVSCVQPIHEHREPQELIEKKLEYAECQYMSSISVIPVKYFPNIFYCINDGYIIRLIPEAPIEVIAIIRPETQHEFEKQENWLELTEKEKEEALRKGYILDETYFKNVFADL